MKHIKIDTLRIELAEKEVKSLLRMDDPWEIAEAKVIESHGKKVLALTFRHVTSIAQVSVDALREHGEEPDTSDFTA